MNLSLGLLVFSPLLLAASPRSLAQAGARFGSTVAIADVNGDGFADVIVGEPFFDGRFPDEGRVLAYHGSPSGPAATPAWIKLGGQPGAHFGAALARAGDMNGDGFEDVAIGAPDHDRMRIYARLPVPVFPLPSDEGRLYLYLGSASGLRANPRLVHPGIEDQQHFGFSVAGAGDVNDDGYDDLIVGGPGTNSTTGGAYVFHGSPTGPGFYPNWAVFGFEPGHFLGSSVSGTGDFNGDGIDDVAVLAPGPDEFYPLPTILVVLGSGAGLQTAAAWAWAISIAGEARLTAASDPNGDGTGAVLVGIPRANAASLHENGTAHVFGNFGFPPDPDSQWTSYGSADDFHFGCSVASGDTDGDGVLDIVIGESTSASIYLFQIPAPGAWHIVRFGNVEDEFGASVSVGDIDGDGADDVVVGCPSWDGSSADAGRVQAFRGNSGGLLVSPSWTLAAP